MIVVYVCVCVCVCAAGKHVVIEQKASQLPSGSPHLDKDH